MPNRLPDPRFNISPERKAVGYLGMAVAAIGLILFMSVFVSAALNFGSFDHFEERGRSMAIRSVSGMILMIIGGIVASISRAGLAGSGISIDPQQARKDLEPYNRAHGGMISDTLDEIPLIKDIATNLSKTSAKEVVKVRCSKCQALNDEQARFCNQCAQPLMQ